MFTILLFYIYFGLEFETESLIQNANGHKGRKEGKGNEGTLKEDGIEMK